MCIDDSIESVKSVSLGLFGFITHPISEEPSVVNLNIKDATIKSNTLAEDDYSGIIAGYALNNDSDNKSIVFKNITVSGSIDTSSISGGMIGGLDKCSVEGCETNISIKNGYNNGGIIGISSEKCIFNNCVSIGSIEGNWCLGGFVGYNDTGEGSDGITDSSFNKDVNPALKCAGGDAPADIVVDALTASILAQEKGVVLVNEKSDNKYIRRKRYSTNRWI